MELEMEVEVEVVVEGEDGSKFSLVKGEKAAFGRGSGFNTHDRTVSRRHVCFQLHHSESELPRVSFEVTGKNPLWVWTHHNALSLFRKFEKGHLQFGDRFCLSPDTPLWFHLNNNQPLPPFDLHHFDVSEIDPVKGFGFLVMGHEFDHYPKGMIQNVKNWEWFLEEPRKDNEDEEDEEKERRKMRRKRKTREDNEDEEWSGENEDDKDLVANIRKSKLPGYSIRSRDSKGPNRDTKVSKNSKQKKSTSVDETEEEDDETLGGFIVADEEDDREEENDEDEEEFEEDDDDDDDEENGVED